MGGGKSSTISNSEQRILSLQIQQSSYGLALPIVFGQNRISGNLIDYSDFTAIATTTTTRSGGKGGGGGVTQVDTTYTYEAAIVMALCHGPIAGVLSCWRDKERHWSLGSLGLSLYAGGHDQQPWAWMQGSHPDRALAYSDTAYVCSPNYALGRNAHVPNHSFEIAGLLQAGAGNMDAEPAKILTALLTDSSYGCGFPANRLSNVDAYGSYCRAAGIYLSPVLQEQQEAREHIGLLLQQTNSAAVWSQGKLKIIPYGDDALHGNGATYIPNLSPVYNLSDDDFIAEDDDDPVCIERKSQADCHNQITIEYLDRANAYNVATATAKDQDSIERHGLRAADPVKMHGICTAAVAQTVAQIALQRALYVRNTYRFSLGWRYCLLEPMDLVELTDAGLGLNKTPVRITEVEEDADGMLAITAEDFPFGVASATANPGQLALGSGTSFNAAPGNSFTPVIFEAPLQLTANEPQIWLATAGGADWGGCSVWVSTDGTSYRKVGQMSGKSRYGSTTAALATGPSIDTAQMLCVDISASAGQLLGGTPQDAQDFITACRVGDEFMAYATATLTGAGRYNLGHLVRAGWGSANDAHPAGSPFVRLSDPLFKYPFPADWMGKTIHIKLASYNVFGAAGQPLDEVQAYRYTIVGAPMGAVAGLRMVSAWTAGRDVRIAWDALAGAASYDVEIWPAATTTCARTAAGLIDNQYTYTPQDARSDGGPWREAVFKVRARAQTGKTGPWSQLVASNPQAGPLQGIKAAPGIKSIYFSCATPIEDDFAGIQIWLSKDPACPTIPANMVYDGSGSFITLSAAGDGTPLAGGLTYYIRAAGYDTFGKDGVHVSASVAVTPWDISALGAEISEANLSQSLKDRIARIDGPESMSGSVAARIASEAQNRANADAAQASALQTVQTSVQGHTASIQTQTQSIDGLKAQYTVKVDNNGQVAGFGLASEPVNGQIISHFIVRADRFGIGAPGAAAQTPFVVDTARNLVGIDGNLVVNGRAVIENLAAGSISGSKIQAGSITSNTLAANSVTAETISAGAVTSDKMKVGSLSAISANLGNITGGALNINNRFCVDAAGNVTIKSADTGARLTISNTLVQVFDYSGRLRVRMGIW